MNLDSIDDVLSDYNTLNLHKLTRNSWDLVVKDRTDLASTYTDSGQNFLYANSDEPLELEPRMGSYYLYSPSELTNTNYNTVNDVTVTRFKHIPGLRNLIYTGQELKDLARADSTYQLEFAFFPQVDGMTTNIQIADSSVIPEGITITKKSDSLFEMTITASELASGELSFALEFIDQGIKEIGYEGTGVSCEVSVSIQAAEEAAEAEFRYLGPSVISIPGSVVFANYLKTPSDAAGYDNLELVSSSGYIRVDTLNAAKAEFQLTLTPTATADINQMVTLSLRNNLGAISKILTESYIAICVPKETTTT